MPRTRLALGGAAQESPRWGEVFGALSSQGWTTIALSCVNGLAISYAGLRVQQLVTATTFMVLTNVNKFAVIVFGVVVLHDALSPLSALGVLMAMGGGFWYANARARMQEFTATAATAAGSAGDKGKAQDDEESVPLRDAEGQQGESEAVAIQNYSARNATRRA